MRAKIVHTVHDCGLTDTPIGEVDRVTELNYEAFEKPLKIIPVRMRIEIEIGKAWGEHKKKSRVYDILDSVGLSDKVA
jgi:DNA polymerase I-like protein with 3'-5' exonuclease and polymerase domains